MLLSLALPPIGQGLLLILSQALFSGLYYLLDVYVIEVWPTEVFLTTNQHGTAYILRSATLASTCWKVSARLDQPLLHWLLTLAVRYVGGDDDNGHDCFDDDDAALAPQVTTSILSKIYQPGLLGTF